MLLDRACLTGNDLLNGVYCATHGVLKHIALVGWQPAQEVLVGCRCDAGSEYDNDWDDVRDQGDQ